MTVLFGLDISNHQSADGFDVGAARAEGFEFLTHKLTEGTWRDPHFPAVAARAREHFPARFGAYVFCRTNISATAEADAAVYAAHDAGFAPGEIALQIDYEDTRNGGSGIDLLDRVTAHISRGWHLLPIYLPRWYWRNIGSPDLSELPVDLWNSHYIGGSGFAATLYPGDGFAGWVPFAGRGVAILQFSETGIAAGESPIDLNAFRGTPAELDRLFGGSAMAEDIAQQILDQELGPQARGWPARRYHLPAAEQPSFSQTDYAREIDAKLQSRLPVYGDEPNPRPVPPEQPDDLFGHVLSSHAILVQIRDMLVEIGDAAGDELGDTLRDLAQGRK